MPRRRPRCGSGRRPVKENPASGPRRPPSGAPPRAGKRKTEDERRILDLRRDARVRRRDPGADLGGAGESPGMTPRLEASGISKAYPGVVANDDVDLRIMPGEIHALLGENGAGKSTLVKIIYGVQRADAGRLAWEGGEYRPQGPAAARALGIGMVFQHFSLFDAMTVEENIALGIAPELARGGLGERIRGVSAQYGLPIDPRRYVHSLSVGERQRIEVVRCLLQNPRLLIMDEPTSVLTPQEAEALFGTLRRLAGEGAQRISRGETDDLATLQPYYLRMPTIGAPRQRDRIRQGKPASR